MSRFGLRSCSDGLKHLEEKNNRRKAALTSKRLITQKESKCPSSQINKSEENLIGIKNEVDDIEKCFDASDKLTKDKVAAGVGENDDDDDENNGNYNDNDDEDDYRQQSPICKGTLVCSLPLDRINEIINRLDLNKSKTEVWKEPDEIMIDETLDNDDDEEDDTNISKQSTSNVKNLCLYCDRKFSSHKMQLKHVEKLHCLQQDRRCSGRNAQLQLQQQHQMQAIPRKRKSATGSQNFTGCNLCQKTKGQSQPVILPATELNSLFVHLIECHSDKYFGCKTCVIRFQNISKLSKHMEIVHKSLPFAFDENSSKSKDNDTDSLVSIDKLSIGERSKLSLKRQQRSQKSANSCMNLIGSSVSTVTMPQCNTAIAPNTSVIGAEEPILSRLGLTQNRLPNNRKGVRLRREKLLPEMLLKSEPNHSSAANFAFVPTTSISASSSTCTTCSPKLRGKSIKAIGGFSTDASSDVVFRIPTRNDILSCVFDDNFYKEVVSNVRNNLHFHLDGKIMGNSLQELDTSIMVRHAHQPQIRSTLVKSPIVVTTMDSEIHAATSLSAITAFPTLLTAQQFGGDASSSKIRRPHTKNSWKWKWDSVKKFKLINEGGKIVKKMKHPMLGLRDLSKLDMWTQLTMRQKHELQQQQKANLSADDNWHRSSDVTEFSIDPSREEKLRINDQLNFILDMRLLPHIILEQNEQAIIKLENDEFGIAPTEVEKEDCGDNFMAQTFADESFLSMLNLLPNYETQTTRTRLVLSGEWARPRCYLCVCCGAKFEKVKSLEEHKMFRHSQILSTHYEVVGRELLNGNLLRHLFIPKKALSRYGHGTDNLIYSGAARRLFWHKKETLIREITNNDESSDSSQSVLHRCVTNSPSLKNSSSGTEDCDIDSKLSTTAALQLIGNGSVVSPTHSIQSCSSSSSAGMKTQLRMQTVLRTTPIGSSNAYYSNSTGGSGCSKCGRKCNGVLDLYRHMLDCSGDYIWSLAKKRKYRYYCGSKKRRPCNKHSILELRKNKTKTTVKSLSISNDNTNEEGAVSTTKIKTSPRSRPSDAESIKKMLENLPPKRICKKIFPTLSKAKKCIKNTIKPKLLAKHKIFNSLRKTRVRQMAKAAKILSKTKSQLKNPKKMATRSTTLPMSSKAAKSIARKTKKRTKLEMNKRRERKLTENRVTNKDNIRINKLDKVMDEVDCSNIKTEKKNTNDVQVNAVVASDKPTEVEKSDPMSKNSTDSLIPNNTKDNFEQSSHDEQLTSADKQAASETILNVSSNVMLEGVPTEVLRKDKVSGEMPVNAIVSSDAERNTQTNTKSVKRSKRISDCIAMLTGKLEEKLKTEQNILVSTDVSQPVKNVSSPVPPKPLQQQLMLALLKPVEKVEKISPRKTPKRKAISRRIIKTDVAESNPLPALTTNLDSKNIPNPKIVNPVEVMSLPKDVLLPNQLATYPMSTSQNSLTTNISVKKFPNNCSQEENKRPINIIPATVITSMPPPVAPPNASALMPKMPLFIPLDNVRPPLASPHKTPMALAMSLPVPVPVSIPIENVSKSSPSSITTAVANINPTPVIPLIAAVPAHLAVSPALQLTVAPFNPTNMVAEPLNLSNSSKNVLKHSEDLSCANIQKLSAMPQRRQTICGFEVRNFSMFDESEPLDLSKKSRPEKSAVDPTLPTRHTEMASILLPPPQHALCIPNESAVLTIPPITSEAMLNKPFYSNLDLLRIPQVRNPAGCHGSVSTNESVQSAVALNVPPAIAQPTKPANKKRTKPTTLQTTINANVIPAASTGEGSVVNTTVITVKTNNTKDITNNNSKKETAAKNKSILRMDEEVINHIDDAINSVINAVKASLDSEEALKVQDVTSLESQSPQQSLIQLKTVNAVNAINETVAPARRNMRSKTLDCRSTALNKICVKQPPAIINQQDDTVPGAISAASSNPTAVIPTIAPNTTFVTENNEILKYLDSDTQVTKCSKRVTIPESIMDQVEAKKENNKSEDQVKSVEVETILLEKPSNENSTMQNEIVSEERSTEKLITTIIVDNSGKEELTQTTKISVEPAELPAITIASQVEDAEAKSFVNSIIMNSTNIELEHMTNNNNTSSGFHSSADQQTSIMSTTTSAVYTPTAAIGSDMKKKQRRRRKNELAAIVADQLLESFKLDKARRDNLKKLENLAYEKSEDLLLTGMLLMSSTKRNVASSSSSNINAQVESTESVVSIKRVGKSQRSNQENEIQKHCDVSTIENKTIAESATEKSLENHGDPPEVGESTDGRKNSKRRQYRRRGKTLENENISKLKSSLESFSIDIERQLTEYESKNVNMFKNLPPNENVKQSSSSKNHGPMNVNKTSIILRPSILSVTLEASANQEIPQTAIKTLTNDSNKTVVSSRDPRLNKNIHKEGEKNIESVASNATTKESVLIKKNNTDPEEIGDLEEDNYLTEIAKNVNEKIMSTENEEFAFKDDGFELVNEMGIDDSNSKFSRPPTSMSVRSAPNFNDDRSNFGSVCDENTNTEVMDMDLDDEMSVYTSYSQDLGNGRGRRRRRRRSILLTRKPKKRSTSRDMTAEKIECILCKKVFYSANSLCKHNMTLAHVSKVSEQEYLLSKSHSNIPNLTNSEELQTYGILGRYARRSTRRATISEPPPMQSSCETNTSPPLLTTQCSAVQSFVTPQSSQPRATFISTNAAPEAPNVVLEVSKQIDASKSNKSLEKPTQKEQISDNEYDVNITANAAYNSNSRLNLNPDERLFFECCNILKSAETPRLKNVVSNGDEFNINANFSYAYNQQEKSSISTVSNINNNQQPANNLNTEPAIMRMSSNAHTNHDQLNPSYLANNTVHVLNQQPPIEQHTLFRDPQLINQSSSFNKASVHDNRNARSPTYSAISHLSAVTNTTSRFKTKAAMKGYENVNIDLNQQQESKSRTICKLTELAEIALGNEEKPNSHNFSPIQISLTQPQLSSHIIHPHQAPKVNIDNVMHPKVVDTPDYVRTLITENVRECNVQLPIRSECTKNNETRSSTSSKTIMHSSIIKAAVEEHQKAQTNNKIIIPERPFKNIGLEEKETITFQKPKAPSVNLLTEDNNSVSTGSFSDRDDYDFGSLSCDDEVSLRESSDKNQKNNTTESSSESSRATAKTFENKSLIMGRIFKNASTKAAIKSTSINTVKVKSVGVQKDQTPVPKADLNQLFDELRGNSRVEDVANDRICNSTVVENNPVAAITIGGNSRANHKQYQQQRENLKPFIPAASPPAVVSSTTAALPTNVRKAKTRVPRSKSNPEAKTRKDISKLQTELGMSPDEIKKLIDEGQRKSKRRCATNRPKKLVEMWSSDEYEEFLSTKDIIALIAEKEQQEKRKKRKSSLNTSLITNEIAKEKEIIADVTSSTKDLKRRNNKRISAAAERSENLILDRDETSPAKNTKIKKASNKKEDPVSTTANITNPSEFAEFVKTSPEKGKTKKIKTAEVLESSSTRTISNRNTKKGSNKKNSANKPKTKPAQKTKQVPVAKESSRAIYKKRQYEGDEESNESISVNDNDDDDDDDFLISELKNKQSKKRGGKGKNSKTVAATSKAVVTSTANANVNSKPSKLSGITRETPTKKRSSNNNTNCNEPNIASGSSNTKNQQHQQQSPAKAKRKNVSNQSPPRRKRLATEKLYYWSSSSDEDFGRINNNKSNPPPDNYESGGEQYQKHGWIVGDSHKKLVTLLAIAKGNKKVDSKSGVKKNIGLALVE